MSDLAGHRDAILERRARLHLTPMTGDPEHGRRAAEEEVDRLVDPVLLEVAGGGHVCLAEDRGVLEVVDVLLPDPVAAPAVRRDVLALALERGVQQVGVNRYPGDASTEAFTDDAGFARTASNLVLDTRTAPAASRARLEPMDVAAFAAFLDTTARGHAEQQVASGAAGTFEEHHARSLANTRSLLPDGLGTPGHHHWHVVVDDERVGRLWVFERAPRAAYVFDVEVGAEHRGRGFGRAAMDAAAAWCHEDARSVLGLNVFGHNTVARGLYDALGYRVVLDYLVTTPR